MPDPIPGSADLEIVDAHVHFWEPGRNYYPWLCDEPMVPFRYGDYSAIRRSYLPPDYFRDAEGHRIVRTVYVEAHWDPRDPLGEVAYVTGLEEQYGAPNAVVAYARIAAEDAESVIATHGAHPLVRGIRNKPAAAASPDAAQRGAPGSMGDPRWREGLHLLEKYELSLDIQSPWWHLAEMAELAADFPRLQIVLNHLGLPADRSKKGLDGWRAAIRELAGQSNVTVKLSGIGVPGSSWTVALNRDIVRDAIEAFGVDRCMFASNFPVDGLTGTFDEIYSGYKAIVADLPEADQRRLFHDNAVRIYRI
ncbi:MAG: amidohydrolase family protein [Betaproteobacteria bacterium]|nr:amidohydrolase family protein [Betaproteobacteria bacterium]